MKAPGLLISPNTLLYVYSILPCMMLLVAIDLFFLHGTIRNLFPRSQSQLFFALVLLDLPHVLASFLSFFDRDYINAYKRVLLVDIPIVCTGLIIIFFYYPLLLSIIYGAWTMYHVIGQQTGIAGMLIKSRNRYFIYWRKVAAAVGILGYFLTYIQPTSLNQSRLLSGAILVVLLISLIALTKLVAKDSTNKLGTNYLWATSSMILFAVILYAYHPFLSFATYLTIHGITAFVYYVVHDVNRNTEIAHNYIYRILTWNKISLMLLAPVLAFSGTLLVYLCVDNWYSARGFQGLVVLVVTSIFPAMHYYTEASMWRQGSIHRNQIAFKR